MSDITDNDLILFHFRDGLPPERLREIERAMSASRTLDARYRALCRLLAEVDRDNPPIPDAQFERRLWQRLQPRLDTPAATFSGVPAPVTGAPHGTRPRRRTRLWGAGLATAAVLVVALNVPIMRDGALPPTPLPQRAATQAPMADRVLASYVATHLRSTEGALLSVINNDGSTLTPAGDDFVRSLVDDNRIYAAAAARRGDKALAGFLESLDPVLIELANQPHPDDIQQRQGLRDFVSGSDLLFQVRAVEARLQSRGDHRIPTRGAMT